MNSAIFDSLFIAAILAGLYLTCYRVKRYDPPKSNVIDGHFPDYSNVRVLPVDREGA